MGDLILITGGQKSGKSSTAARRAASTGRPVVVLAPAQASDAEMAERIDRHREDRPPSWRTIETFDLLAGLAEVGADATVVVDAIDTWLAHAMEHRGLLVEEAVAALGAHGRSATAAILEEVDRFVAASRGRTGVTVVVGGQVGSALAPMGAGARRYVDLHGVVMQRLSRAATDAVLVVAGRALTLPPAPGPEPACLGFRSVEGLIGQIASVDRAAAGQARQRHDELATPAGSLGRLESLGAQLAGIAGRCPPPVAARPALLVACGDHGVHAQGVSPWPQNLTAAIARAVADGVAASGPLARQVAATVSVLDVGMADMPRRHPALRTARVRAGTRDLSVEAALTVEEASAAILAGADAAADLVAGGADLLVLGEVGIGNTTPSACLIAAITRRDPAEVTGRGSGIGEDLLAHKTAVVRRALDRHGPDRDPLSVLASLGGLEHAALTGAMLAAAAHRVPVLLDGVTTNAAALVATALAPSVAGYLIAGHASVEPGAGHALAHLGLDPLLRLGLRLGEGTGALLAVPLVQAAARVLQETALLTELAEYPR